MHVGRRPLLKGLLAAAGIAGVSAVATGCVDGRRIEVGSPAPYTPPPPGIDELYRADALSRTTVLLASLSAPGAAAAFTIDGASEAGAALADLPRQWAEDLGAHERALQTGAEAEASAAASDGGASAGSQTLANSQNPESPSASADAPASEPASPASLARALADLRDLYAFGAIQVSGTLARLFASAGSWCTWALSRLTRLASALGIDVQAPEAPALGALIPTRDVPANDPPVATAASELTALLPGAQTAEWEAAYTLEVVASRDSGEARSRLVGWVAVHRERAEAYGEVASAVGLEPVRREAGYPLPSPLDAARLTALTREVSFTSLTNAIALTYGAPFTHRAPFVAAWLTEAGNYAEIAAGLESLPGLESD
ncbi:MAG: DUF4439 domain-containing protein [Dermabacter sp.]|nr:DUF4439 domain-containing protein [Dermabacter sp.]